MFQPMGPNFLLSYTIAWKKQKPNNRYLTASGFVQSSTSFQSMASYVPSTFYLRPLGGSSVILTEFYNTETGKPLEGIEVIQSLKSL